MEKFRVPQRKVPARLLLRDGRELAGELYVPAGGPGGGPGSVTDRLADREESFLPFAGSDGGRLLNKAWITGVQLRSSDAGPELPEPPSEHQVKVRLRLAGGSELRGTVGYSMPEEKGRLIDYLNAAPRFLLLHTGGGVTLVNREQVVEAEREEPEES